MVRRPGRNERCPCGSGLKFKRCHGAGASGLSSSGQFEHGEDLPGFDLADCLRRIKELAVSDDDFSDLVDEIRRLAKRAPGSWVSFYRPGMLLHRVTTHHSNIPQRIDEIAYPPPTAVRTFGRANRPSRPVFYCCAAKVGAFLEARAAPGQYVVCAEWQTTVSMTVHEIGYTKAALAQFGVERELQPMQRAFYESHTPEAATVRSFWEKAFTDPTPAHYRITAAIADWLLTGGQFAGLKYPSIAGKGKFDNFALRTEFVQNYVRLARATVDRVDGQDDAGIRGTRVADLKELRDGVMYWEPRRGGLGWGDT